MDMHVFRMIVHFGAYHDQRPHVSKAGNQHYSQRYSQRYKTHGFTQSTLEILRVSRESFLLDNS